jgi:hypothetical protein
MPVVAQLALVNASRLRTLGMLSLVPLGARHGSSSVLAFVGGILSVVHAGFGFIFNITIQ